jgi:hypothetical protein
MDEPKHVVDRKKLWRTVIELHQVKLGFSRADAVNYVIMEWLCKGEIDPLLDAIETGELDDPVLSLIARMFMRDKRLPYYLTVHRQSGKGAGKKPGSLYRDMLMALTYEVLSKQLCSEKAFDETAKAFVIGVSSVRRAVSWYRALKLQAIDLPTIKKS